VTNNRPCHLRRARAVNTVITSRTNHTRRRSSSTHNHARHADRHTTKDGNATEIDNHDNARPLSALQYYKTRIYEYYRMQYGTIREAMYSNTTILQWHSSTTLERCYVTSRSDIVLRSHDTTCHDYSLHQITSQCIASHDMTWQSCSTHRITQLYMSYTGKTLWRDIAIYTKTWHHATLYQSTSHDITSQDTFVVWQCDDTIVFESCTTTLLSCSNKIYFASCLSTHATPGCPTMLSQLPWENPTPAQNCRQTAARWEALMWEATKPP